MGSDKAALLIDGVASGRRLAKVLLEVVDTALEVGPSRSGLPAIVEDPPGLGPLFALVTGWRALRQRGHTGAVLVLACDLPFVERPLLELLASGDPTRSCVPVVDGRRQYLCARWSPADLERGASSVACGERSVRAAFDDSVCELGEAQWSAVASARCFADVDTLDDLDLYGLAPTFGERASQPAPVHGLLS